MYTRHPDFFDGETTPATIHFLYDSTAKQTVPKASFRADLKSYVVDARYIYRQLNEGQKVEVIYEKEDPSKAAVYRVWGYWIRWQELLGSVAALIVLFLVAVAITKDPAAEAVRAQMEFKEEKKRKYMD